MAGTYKRLVRRGKQPMLVEDEEIPTPPPNGLLVKVKFAGICHSDCMLKHDCEDPPWVHRLPFVQGHEISGVVHTLGSDIQNSESLKLGTHVVVFCWAGCLDCSYCNEDSTLCQYRFITPKDHMYGVGCDGGFQEYCLIHDSSLVLPLPDGIPLDLGCLLGCSGLTTYNAVSSIQSAIERVARNQESASLLVVGAGGLGLWTVAIAKAVLPSNTKVVVADISETKLRLAKEKGADDTVLWKRDDEPEEQVKRTRAACGGGLDAAIDLVNMTATMATVFNSANAYAVMTVVGLFKGTMPPLPLHAMPMQCLTVKGVLTGNITQLSQLIELVDRKKLRPIPISHVKLDDVDNLITELDEGKIEGRAIVKFE